MSRSLEGKPEELGRREKTATTETSLAAGNPRLPDFWETNPIVCPGRGEFGDLVRPNTFQALGPLEAREATERE